MQRRVSWFLLVSAGLAFGAAFGAGADETAAVSPVDAIQQISPPEPGAIPDVDPLALYDGDMIFDVYRKKSRVGEHRVTFTRDGDRLNVRSRFHLAVKVLFIEAYEFDYEATEVWEKGALIAFSSAVDDNGKKSNTTARLENGVFQIDGPKGRSFASQWVFPSNHWHQGQVKSATILNTLTGKLANIVVQPRGIDRVETGGGLVDAEHLEYTGDLRDTEVWYDRDGRWVKMIFKAKDGSKIEYRCRQCGTGTGFGQTVEAQTPDDDPVSDEGKRKQR